MILEQAKYSDIAYLETENDGLRRMLSKFYYEADIDGLVLR